MSGPRKEIANRTNDLCLPPEVEITVGRKYNQKKKKQSEQRPYGKYRGPYKEEKNKNTISSVQFSRSVVSDSLRPHELQHTRPPCPSPTPGVHPNSCPSSR